VLPLVEPMADLRVVKPFEFHASKAHLPSNPSTKKGVFCTTTIKGGNYEVPFPRIKDGFRREVA